MIVGLTLSHVGVRTRMEYPERSRITDEKVVIRRSDKTSDISFQADPVSCWCCLSGSVRASMRGKQKLSDRKLNKFEMR